MVCAVYTSTLHFSGISPTLYLHLCFLAEGVDSFWHLLFTRGLFSHWDDVQSWEAAELLPVSVLEAHSLPTCSPKKRVRRRWSMGFGCGLCCVSNVPRREREDGGGGLFKLLFLVASLTARWLRLHFYFCLIQEEKKRCPQVFFCCCCCFWWVTFIAWLILGSKWF